jgi:hypothetical protein
VLREVASPAALSYLHDGAERVRALSRKAADAVKLPWTEKNALVLRRGPYVIAAGLDESLPGEPLSLSGHFVDLFDPQLPVVTEVKMEPARRALLLDLDEVKKSGPAPRVIAAACRIRDEIAATDRGRLSFHTEGVAESDGVVRILAPRVPSSVWINGQPIPKTDQDFDHGTLRIRFPNSPQGAFVEISFTP